MQNWFQPCTHAIKAAGKHPQAADFEAVLLHVMDADKYPDYRLPSHRTLGEWLINMLCEPKYAAGFMCGLRDHLAASNPALATRLFRSQAGLVSPAAPVRRRKVT